VSCSPVKAVKSTTERAGAPSALTGCQRDQKAL